METVLRPRQSISTEAEYSFEDAPDELLEDANREADMIGKGPMKDSSVTRAAADQFYSLLADFRKKRPLWRRGSKATARGESYCIT